MSAGSSAREEAMSKSDGKTEAQNEPRGDNEGGTGKSDAPKEQKGGGAPAADKSAAKPTGKPARRDDDGTPERVDLESRDLSFAELEAAAGTLDAATLKAFLEDGRATVKRNALRGLAVLQAAPGGMVPLLRDSDTSVALAAAAAIERLGPAMTPLLSQIAAALEKVKPEVADVVLEALAGLVGKADEALIATLDVAPELGQNTLVRALARAGEAGIMLLVQALTSDKVRIRYNSLQGIERLFRRDGRLAVKVGRKVMRPLAEVRDSDVAADVRAAAEVTISALLAQQREYFVQMAQRAAEHAATINVVDFALRPLTDDELKAQLSAGDIERMTFALSDGRNIVRGNAARALAVLREQAGDAANGAVKPIAVLLRDSSPNARIAAAEALVRFGPAALEVADVLVSALADAEELVADAASRALRSLGKAALPELRRGLDTDDRHHARRILAIIDDLPGAADILCDAFISPSVDVQVNAALGLSLLGHDRVGPRRSVLEVARTGGDARTRRAVRKALSMLAPPATAGPPPITVAGFEERLLGKGDFDPKSLNRDSIIAALADGRTVVRANAATALGVLGPDDRNAARALAVLLRDGIAEVRRNAAAALGSLGKSAIEVAASLVDALGDDDPQVVRAATDSLAEFGQEALPALLEGLGTDRREHAIRVLHLVHALPDAVGILCMAFQSPAVTVQVNSALGLGMLGRDRVGDRRRILEAARTGGYARTRRAVSEALAMLEPPAASGPPPVAVPGFAERLLDAGDFKGTELGLASVLAALDDGRAVVRANALTALGVLGEKAESGVHEAAILLRDSSAEVRRAAARALKRLGKGAVRAAPYLVGALADADVEVASAAADTLASLGEAVLPALIRGLDTDNRAQAVQIIQLLAAFPNAAEILGEAFRDPSVDKQVNAALGMGMLGAGQVGDQKTMLEGARTGGDARTRAAVRAALAMLAPPSEAGPPPVTVAGFEERPLAPSDFDPAALDLGGLLAALSDGRALVRANAATAIGVIGGAAAGAARALAVLCRDGDPGVRRAAAQALGKLGPGGAEQAAALVATLGDDDPDVARAASESLAAMGDAARAALLEGLETDSRIHAIRLAQLISGFADAVDLLCAAFAGPAVNVQVNAALALGMLGRQRVGDRRAMLEDARTGGDGNTRRAVREALAMLAPPPAASPPPVDVPGFADTLLAPGDFDKSKLVLASLLEALTDGRRIVRANAATAVAAMGKAGGAAAGEVAVLLRDGIADVRAAGAAALGQLGEAAVEFADALVAALGDREPVVANAAADSLRALGEAVVPALIRGLDTDNETRARHVIALIGARADAVELLCSAFQSPAINVQVNAARGLGSLGPKRVGARRNVLEAAQWVGDLRTRRAVRGALNSLGYTL